MAIKFLNVIQNRIIQFNIFLLILGTCLFIVTKKYIYLFTFFIVFIVNEIIYYLCGSFDLYNSHNRTELLYSAKSVTSLVETPSNPNLTEGLFKKKNCNSIKEVEKYRFEEFIRILQIKKGDSVLDAGCGFGGLVMYLRGKGINAKGITITKTQFKINTDKYGPYFYLGDYTVFQPQLVNKFDFIILPGSLEHPFGGNVFFMKSYKNKYEKMSKMFGMMKKYFKKNSAKKKILTTVLHINLKFKNDYRLFISERMFGGLLPPISIYSVADSLKNSGYRVLSNKDYSWHYYYTSYCDITHFGNPWDMGLKILLTIPFHPHVLYAYIYWKYGYWMWMFDGKSHYPRKTKICDPKNGCDLTFVKDIKERPTTLYYTVAQLI